MNTNQRQKLALAFAGAAAVLALASGGQALAAHTSASTTIAASTTEAAVGAGPAVGPVVAAVDEAGDDAELRGDCRAKADELEAREERGEIDWDVLEDRLDPETEPEDSVELTLPPIDGRVAAPDERLERLDYQSDLALGDLTDADLLEAVVVCEDHGWLPVAEEDPDDEEPDEEDLVGDGETDPDES